MAKYQIRFACGHETEIQLFGKEADRQCYICWAEKYGACEACRAADAIKALEAAEVEYDLPVLTGSEKQIAWARKIRSAKIAEFVAYVEAYRPKVPADQMDRFNEHFGATTSMLAGKTTASFWLDRRETKGQDIATAVYNEAKK